MDVALLKAVRLACQGWQAFEHARDFSAQTLAEDTFYEALAEYAREKGLTEERADSIVACVMDKHASHLFSGRSRR